MAMAQFLVQTSSTHERNHHDEGKMCLKYFDLVLQLRKTTHNCRRGETSDLKWNGTDDRRAKKTNPPTQVVECQQGTAMELDDDAFPVKFLHDFIAYICKYPWQQWNWSWREDLISFVWERKLGIWDVLFSHMQSTFGPNHSILNLHQVWKMSLYSK